MDDASRDELLAFAARALSPRGLFYVSYNALPGWSVRGLVREYLCAQTQGIGDPGARARAARRAAEKLASVLQPSDHPYSRLMAVEFAIVRDAKDSYVAHEYLAETNRAYWQSEILVLLERHGLAFVADADFAYPSARLPEGLGRWVDDEGLAGRARCDTLDLLCYAQFRCALASRAGAPREPWRASAVREMRIASNMVAGPEGGTDDDRRRSFKTAAGYDVVFRSEEMERPFLELARGASRPVEAMFERPEEVAEDLVLLHRSGAVELRSWESPLAVCPILRAREQAARGEFTSPQHLRIAERPSRGP